MSTGQQFGNYRLMKLLGEGGFAQVYLGEHIHLGTQAAVKILTTKLTQEEIAQFRNEARLMMSMDHPHIIRVLDFGMQGMPYLIMPYASRGSLRGAYPRESRLQLSQTVSYVNQVASALHYIHNRKLIHRDVKPENMLIGTKGEVLLSDFGIAVVAHSEHSLGQERGDIGGTGIYMAPEQFQGKPRTTSDQYALGIIVYEWLTGAPPFRGNIAHLAYQHLSCTPQPLHEWVAVSPQVEAVIFKALKKDPKERFPTVQDFAIALEQASHMNSETRSSGKAKNLPSFSEMADLMSQQVPALPGVLQKEPHLSRGSSPAPTRIASGIPFVVSHSPVSSHSPFLSTERALPSAGKGERFSAIPRTPSFVAPLLVRKKKVWLRVLPFVLIIGVFLVVSSGILSMAIALTKGISQTKVTSAPSESETTATTFLRDVAQQDYNRAYENLDASLALVMTSPDFARQAQAADHCYGPIIGYTETTSTVKNGQQNIVYTVTRSKSPHSYEMSVILLQDADSGKWLISGYGKNDDLGPAPPVC